MPRWSDIATWVGPTVNTSGTITDHMYVVLHTADGSYEGTIAWQRNPAAQVSSHFIVAKDGRIGQMLDTDAKGWTQIEGNPYSISIENEGNENTALTGPQIEACAQILARAHQVHGVPLQLTGKVGTRGLGHHSMGAESGVNWGHSQCPGNIIKAQKPQILARAIQLAGGGSPTPTPQGEPAMFVAHDSAGMIYLCDGIRSKPVPLPQRGPLQTLINEGLISLVGPTLGSGGRGGWDESFGKLDPVLAPATVDVAALAASLKAAGIGQVDVDTLAAALAPHLPSHIALTGTVT